MKKRNLVIIALITLFCLTITVGLSSCGKVITDNDLYTKFAEVSSSSERYFDFQADLQGWQTAVSGANNKAEWTKSAKTLQPAVMLSGTDADKSDIAPNALIYNKFDLADNDRYLFLDVTTILDEEVNLRVRVTDMSDESKSFTTLSVANASMKTQDGYTVINGESKTRLTFDLRSFSGKTVVVLIEMDCVGSQTEGVYVNEISLIREYSVNTKLSKWTPAEIASDWELRGNVVCSDQRVVLSNNDKGSSICNQIRVSADNPYLLLSLMRTDEVEPQISVYVGGVLIKSENVDAASVSGSSEQFTQYCYDLLDYADQITSIEIVNGSKGSAAIDSISFVESKMGFSKLTSWDIDQLFKNWTAEGKVSRHNEGLCLEVESKKASITNVVPISAQACYLNISFRMFIRPVGTAQELPPKVSVYVNDQLIRAIGNNQDYVTVDSDDYITFAYDLSQYVGESVTIKIMSVSGQHACFNKIYLDGTAAIEKVLSNSEQFTSDYFEKVNQLTDREFDFVTDVSGWTLGNGGAQYDVAEWIASGRNGNPCIKLDGSDLGDKTNYLPNSWLCGKFTLTDNDKYMMLNLTGSADADTNMRVRVITEAEGKLIGKALRSDSYEKDVDDYGYYLIDGNSGSKYVFDLTEFIGKTVVISIEQDDNGDGSGELINLSKVKFSATNSLLSQMSEWYATTILDEWDMTGNVELHSQGVCLENYGTNSTISNMVTVNESKPVFEISFRKFTREDSQDVDPRIELFVNGKLIRSISSAEDFVTVTGDEYLTFGYDLGEYVGQNVTVKIVSVAGEHACFDSLAFVSGK